MEERNDISQESCFDSLISCACCTPPVLMENDIAPQFIFSTIAVFAYVGMKQSSILGIAVLFSAVILSIVLFALAYNYCVKGDMERYGFSVGRALCVGVMPNFLLFIAGGLLLAQYNVAFTILAFVAFIFSFDRAVRFCNKKDKKIAICQDLIPMLIYLLASALCITAYLNSMSTLHFSASQPILLAGAVVIPVLSFFQSMFMLCMIRYRSRYQSIEARTVDVRAATMREETPDSTTQLQVSNR